jgi:hypothetical protein
MSIENRLRGREPIDLGDLLAAADEIACLRTELDACRVALEKLKAYYAVRTSTAYRIADAALNFALARKGEGDR